MRKVIVEKKSSKKEDNTQAISYPAFTQKAEDTINDFLQKYPINIPLRIVLR